MEKIFVVLFYLVAAAAGIPNQVSVPASQRCVPNTTFVHDDGCNSCFCREPGFKKDAGCTRMSCPPLSVGARKHRSLHLVPPVIEPFSFGENVWLGLNTRISCILAHPDMTAKFSWLKDGAAIPSHILVIEFWKSYSVLSFKELTFQDSGSYTCVATNEQGSANHTSQLIVEVFSGPPVIEPFSFPPYNGKRRKLKVSCRVAQPYMSARFSWLKDGAAIPSHRKFQARGNKIMTQMSVLSLKNLTPRDSGSYTCVATNNAGSANHTSQLIVEVPPVIEPFSFGENVWLGLNTWISCSLTHPDMTAKFSWLKDGAAIPSHLKVFLVKTKEGGRMRRISVLSFKNLTLHDSGSYTCVATNNAGSYNHTSQLNVKVALAWLREPEDVSVSAGSDVLVPCEAQGFHKPTVSWLRGKEKKTADFVPVEQRGSRVHVTPEGGLSISALTPSDEGFYKCKVRNGIGKELSKVIRISLNAVKREEAPQS